MLKKFHQLTHAEIIAQFGHLIPIVEDALNPPYTETKFHHLERFITCSWDELKPFEPHEQFQLYGALGLLFDKMIEAVSILYDNNRLTPALVKEAILFIPTLFEVMIQFKGKTHPLTLYLHTIHKDVVWDVAQDLSSLYHRHLIFWWYPNHVSGDTGAYFVGSRYLVLATGYILNHHITHLNIPDRDEISYFDPPFYTLENTVSLLAYCAVNDSDTPQKRAEIIQQLRDVVESHPIADKTAPFKLLLPLAPHFRDILCEVIGWDMAIPLIESLKPKMHTDYNGIDELLSVHEHPNYIVVADVKRMIANIPTPILHGLLLSLNIPLLDVYEKVYLIRAMLGLNRDDVVAKFADLDPLGIQAYGLLPLAQGETVADRYQILEKRIDDVPMNRRANQRAEYIRNIRLAQDYLAQVAGYSDATQLEWALQAEWIQTITRQWTVDDYTIRLNQDGLEVGLTVYKGDVAMKSVPKAVRGAVYDEAMETVKRLRAQISHLRLGLLEDLIASGRMLTQDEMNTLLRLPIARAMFSKMIWRNLDGAMGLWDVDRMVLVDLDGQTYPVGDSIGLAHSYHLFQANTLSAWQKYVVHHRIVQPIKQAFRELYILTPAEIQTGNYSNRFNGHQINGIIAIQLLVGRGWRVSDSKGDKPILKRFGQMDAVILTKSASIAKKTSPVQLTKIYFAPHPPDHLHPQVRKRLIQQTDWFALADIPPLIFSEVMRDADLIVSVAQWDSLGEPRLSKESFATRAQLVTTLLDDLGLPNVRIEGHFAYITGKLADYRVHLGSAVIHVEPGNYLCIVPDNWGMTHEKLFLPFSDNQDKKISEVISKILLLIADDKIKDESILRQIRRKSE